MYLFMKVYLLIVCLINVAISVLGWFTPPKEDG
jgi:hypothetical protein